MRLGRLALAVVASMALASALTLWAVRAWTLHAGGLPACSGISITIAVTR